MRILDKKTAAALCALPVVLMMVAGAATAKPSKPTQSGGSDYDQFLICKKKPKACGSTADLGKPKPKPKPKPSKLIVKYGGVLLNTTPIPKAAMQ